MDKIKIKALTNKNIFGDIIKSHYTEQVMESDKT